MSALETIYAASISIRGHEITWREIVGNAFGFASAVGGLRRQVWAWPVGIVGNVLLFTVFAGTAVVAGHGAPLYGQAARQLFFIAVSVYGWVRWRQQRRRRAETHGVAVIPRWASAAERLAYVGVALPAVLVAFFVFRQVGAGFPAAWWYYLADSWIFVGSMLATYAMARGWVDFWLCWIAVDLVGIPELIHFGFYPSAVLFGIYGVLVVYGFVAWRRLANAGAARPGPARTADVPA